MTMPDADLPKLLCKLAQIIQHLRRQFTLSVGSYVDLNDGVEQLVDLLKHFHAHILVLFDRLVRVDQFP